MKTVLIIGAGATLAEALPTRPPRDKHPPLDTTFFHLAHLAKLDGRNRVKDYMQQNYGIDPIGSEHRMEEIFNYIYSDAFSGNPPPRCLDAYWALLQMYRNAIARTTNGLLGTSRFGVGALLRFLWRNSKDREIEFITFNHDLVIENSIETTASMATYGDIPWNFNDSYGMFFVGFNTYTNRPNEFSDRSGRTILIYKLHGSLNWFYAVRSGSDPRNSIRTPAGRLRCLNDKYIRLGSTTMSGAGPGSRSVSLISLVVPPIYEKASRYQQVIKPIWDKARSALLQADELIVFGYSFPDMDFAAKSLLRQSFIKNDNLRDIHVIDTDPWISSKICELLDAKCTYHYRSVPDFVDHYV